MNRSSLAALRSLLPIVLLAAGITGCAASSLSAAEIFDSPIAFIVYDAEATRLHAEAAERALAKRTGQTTSRPKDGVGDMNEFARFIAQQYGLGRAVDDSRTQGRLALLDPRSGTAEIVKHARRGAVPQAWSPDRTRLLYAQVVHDEMPQLFELEVASGETRRLTYGDTAHPEGCYGPDGSIVFTSVDVSSGEPMASIMWTGDAGKTSERLSPPGYSYYPTCAPDGSAVAFTHVPGAMRSQRIYIRSPIRTGEPRELSRGGEPSFSADGEWISFSALIGDQWRLWRIRPDGSGRTSLGFGGRNEHRPALAPDNHVVAYVVDSGFHRELFIRRADGSGDRILYDDGDGDRPVW